MPKPSQKLKARMFVYLEDLKKVAFHEFSAADGQAKNWKGPRPVRVDWTCLKIPDTRQTCQSYCVQQIRYDGGTL